MSGRGLLLNSKQFSDFLVSLSPPKYISSCTSDDVIKLLISKDSSGRTVVHSQLCPKVKCNCPKRLAAGTVDSLLGKLNANFNNIGRLRLTLESTLNLFARKRQARLLSPPRQCLCFMLRFLNAHFLRHSIRCSSYLSLVKDYILVRDIIFFVVDFSLGTVLQVWVVI